MGDPIEPLSSVYLETSVVSYATARLSRDPLIRGHQELTRRWWDGSRHSYHLFTSPATVSEAGEGDPEEARKRLEYLAEADTLEAVPRVLALAAELKTFLHIPEKKGPDAAHLAFAVHYHMVYLLTWNCAHLANEMVRRALADLCRERELWMPIICTPEEMIRQEKEC